MQGGHDDHIMALCWAAWLLNPDIIEKYNIVVETFTSSLDKILPKTLHSYFEYTQNDLNTIYSDPIYKQYLDFKDEMVNKYLLDSVKNNSKEQENTIISLQADRNKSNQAYKPTYSGQSFFIPGSSNGFDDFDEEMW
jgi:hypothetical protein